MKQTKKLRSKWKLRFKLKERKKNVKKLPDVLHVCKNQNGSNRGNQWTLLMLLL